MKQITSDQNATFKKALRLHDSRGRRQQNRVIIFGINEIRLANRNGIEFSEFFVNENLLHALSTEIDELQASGAQMLCLPDSLFRKLSFGGRNDGMIATAIRPDTSLDAFTISAGGLYVVLESIEKPGNMGAVFRTADAAGVSGIFLADAKCDAFHPNAIRSSLGTVFSIACAKGSSRQIREWLIRNQIQIAAARVDGSTNYLDVQLANSTAIVLGSEHDGLSEIWSGDGIVDFSIPMQGAADSLNVSTTAAILVYEAVRQRLQ